MTRRKDLTGQRFGRLLVLEYTHSNKNLASYWKCACACGNTPVVRGSSLSAGVIRSCGCYSAEQSAKRRTTHGGDGTQAYSSWRHRRARWIVKE